MRTLKELYLLYFFTNKNCFVFIFIIRDRTSNQNHGVGIIFTEVNIMSYLLLIENLKQLLEIAQILYYTIQFKK